MLDRECKDDLPALVTKVSRRQRRTDEEVLSQDSAAVIIRRNSQEFENCQESLPEAQATASKKQQNLLDSLPHLEKYNEQKKGRNPYLCVPCNKKFAKSSLSSHVKSKHRSKSPKVKCCLCNKVFDKASKAQDHVSSTHKVYLCPHGDLTASSLGSGQNQDRQNSSRGSRARGNRNCSDSFSEFDKLKAHLKASHEGSEWPWICGFCDLVLLYDLEFEVHIKQHTEKPPFSCPICSRLFSDNSRLREHLVRQHLPSRDTAAASTKATEASAATNSNQKQHPHPPSAAQIKFEKQQAQLAQHQLQVFERLRSSLAASTTGAMTDSQSLASRRGRGSGDTEAAKAAVGATSTSSSSASNVKDEAAVSRELAALLLNLHDSNGRAPVTKVDNFSSQNSAALVAATAAIQLPKAEDLSLKASVETAIDLTKSKPEITLTPTMPASITKLVKGQTSNSTSGTNNGSSGVTVTKTSVKAPSYPASSAGSNSSAAQAAAAASGYPFYPSLASMTSLSPTLAMNSNYLLHNLLLGKFQQIANSSSNSASSGSPAVAGSNTTSGISTASTASTATGSGVASTMSLASTTVSSNMASLPTHPLPAQALTLPASKPPASVLKSASSQQPSVATSNGTSGSRSSSSSTATASTVAASAESASQAAAVAAAAAGYSSLQLLQGDTNSSTSNNGIDIPYMCRQIVTLLNGLLFHQHNLNNHTVEMNVHTQLGAIYTRLQEVVVMVEQAKKQQEAAKVAAATVAAVTKKEEKHLKDTKQKEEEKIAKHIHEYQRLLQKQHEQSTKSQSDLVTQVTNDLKSQSAVNAAQAAVVSAAVQAASAAASVAANSTGDQVDVVDSMQEDNLASDLASMKNRRRGRPPKNSNMDLSYSPPEKKLRMPLADVAGNPHQQPEIGSSGKYSMASNGVSNDPTSPMVATAVAAVTNHLNGHVTNGGVASQGSTAGGKGGKGIRNRVFCGECTGCLKNDDCGKCRYCKDKTKFGGQNRLRQKCLHRRCQLDTHRRRSSQNNSQGGSVNQHGGGSNHVGSNGHVGNNSSFSDNVGAVSRQSPSPDAIYSGVALARLASQSNLVVDTTGESAIKESKNGQLSPGEIIRSSGQPVFPQVASAATSVQIDVSRMTNPMPQSLRAQQRSGSSASNASDEDTDDHKSGSRTQSRIDKWKAKHEAMLKMASDNKKQAKTTVAMAAAAAAAAVADLQDTKSASSEDEAAAASAAQTAASDLKAACLQSLTKQLPPPPAALSVK